MIELSIILPVLNEAKFIGQVVQDIIVIMEASGIKYEIILAENGSTDNSLQVLNELAGKHSTIKVCVAPHRGWGIAIQTAFRVVNGDFICHMPSDGQINPTIVPRLWHARESTDIVKIKRVTRENFKRLANSKVYNLIAKLLFGIRLADINGCPKIYKKSHIGELSLISKDSFFDLEMIIKAKILKYKIKEIATDGLNRIGGRSNTNLKTVAEFIRNMLRFKFGAYFSRWISSVSREQ